MGENKRQGEMREAGSARDRHPPDVSFKRKEKEKTKILFLFSYPQTRPGAQF